ncbi:cation/calcium exchanger 1-like [Magnolia sinica]|uniref:cation/calcium exchanger 1-like n=1 Tax=Magnolia sinica TaxID=86752 RepID=UPI00265819F1|nr:cation/calcium exchanger 1-like [Magnolia sinica]
MAALDPTSRINKSQLILNRYSFFLFSFFLTTQIRPSVPLSLHQSSTPTSPKVIQASITEIQPSNFHFLRQSTIPPSPKPLQTSITQIQPSNSPSLHQPTTPTSPKPLQASITQIQPSNSPSLNQATKPKSPKPLQGSITQIQPSNSHSLHQFSIPTSPKHLHDSTNGCTGLQRYEDAESRCAFVRSKECKAEGYIDYLQIFYCTFGHHTFLGYAVLIVWLVLLFYLLGNTAACYFCSSLETLSRLLKLSPTIAGVTLLALGNGAPDVFSSIASFVGSGSGSTGDVGLNSILGGAFFVSSVVMGIISILVGPRGIAVDQWSFIRDICFYIIVLASLLAILIVGHISIWVAAAFASLYILYVLAVYATHFFRKKGRLEDLINAVRPLLPISKSAPSDELGSPLLGDPYSEKPNLTVDDEDHEGGSDDDQRPATRCLLYYFRWFLRLVELPLYLPRRLTIPVVCEEEWSKPFAVISVTLAPVLMAALWNSQNGDMGLKSDLVIYQISGLMGLILGVLAFFTTDWCGPPKRFLLIWVAGGFFMSVIWSYIIADELVALMVSIGNIAGISPSILGLTVLAWGNSLGDLIANVALSVKSGPDGVQIAIAGCYAGPIFNTLVGLGLPLVFSSWRVHPSTYVVPKDSSLYQTLGFLVGGLMWALVILTRKGMKLDRVLGGGLLAIYLCFLSLRLAHALGWVQLF